MQEELEQKSVAISIKAGKLTANLLKKALEKALAEMTKSQKNPKIYKGKQSVKHLVRQGAGIIGWVGGVTTAFPPKNRT